MKILVTGAAGFIGYHVCKKLLVEGIEVVGFDNLNNYYDQNLKENRIKDLIDFAFLEKKSFNFIKGDLVDLNDLGKVFNNSMNNKLKISIVIHLAAQAGVRYSIQNPSAYVQSNLVGFCNIIEESKSNNVDHFIYASSSSVYGGNKKLPFKESDNVDSPISLYAATKKSNELIAYTYSHLFNLSTIGLRFFTVYGPWGRPDMALYKFTESIVNNKPIKVFNYGNMIRDFTFVDDVIQSIFEIIKKLNKKNITQGYLQSNISPPYRIFNIGNSNPTNLNKYIEAIEKTIGKKATILLEKMQPGDVEATYADTSDLEEWINFKPKTSIEEGIAKFIQWYFEYNERDLKNN